MSDLPPSPDGPRERLFRWQGLLGRASEAVFVLDRRRRLLYVNPAWEQLTGCSAERARGLICRRSAPVSADGPAEDALAHILTPPADLGGQPARTRRRAWVHTQPGAGLPPRWWDIDFLPIRQADRAGKPSGYLVIGRILPLADSVVEVAAAPGLTMLPERLIDLRQRQVNRHAFDLLDSQEPRVRRLAQQARVAAPLATAVMLVGEPGTGKRTLARILHAQGPRANQPFAALDCRLIPPPAVGEIWQVGTGHFRPGLVYLANPERLPLEAQQGLLDRLGGESVASESAGASAALLPRLVVGFSSEPEQALRSGRLLSGLYWRLSVLRLDLPPLRDRRADLPRLAERMLTHAAACLARDGNEEKRPVCVLGAAAWEALNAYPWPGNLAELRDVLFDSAGRAGGKIDLAELPSKVRLALQFEQGAVQRPRPLEIEPLMLAVESRLIRLALRRCDNNRARAAEMLGMPRARLLRRMDALGLGGDGERQAGAPPADPAPS